MVWRERWRFLLQAPAVVPGDHLDELCGALPHAGVLAPDFNDGVDSQIAQHFDSHKPQALDRMEPVAKVEDIGRAGPQLSRLCCFNRSAGIWW